MSYAKPFEEPFANASFGTPHPPHAKEACGDDRRATSVALRKALRKKALQERKVCRKALLIIKIQKTQKYKIYKNSKKYKYELYNLYIIQNKNLFTMFLSFFEIFENVPKVRKYFGIFGVYIYV